MHTFIAYLLVSVKQYYIYSAHEDTVILRAVATGTDCNAGASLQKLEETIRQCCRQFTSSE